MKFLGLNKHEPRDAATAYRAKDESISEAQNSSGFDVEVVDDDSANKRLQVTTSERGAPRASARSDATERTEGMGFCDADRAIRLRNQVEIVVDLSLLVSLPTTY